jgi:Flp pilus assembly protein TadB
MELSERERRLLQEMESRLLAEDPSLASSMRIHRLRVSLKSVLAISGVPVGALLMMVGVWRAHLVGIVIALVGYLILLFSTVVVGEALRARRGDRRRVAPPVGSSGAG